MNSRGLSSPRFFDYTIRASGRRGTATLTARPRLCRRHFFVLPIIPRVQEPAAIRPLGFASFRRLSAINVYHYVMLNLFQHLTASLYLPPLLGEILKQVQDDMMDGVRMTFRDAVSHLLVSEGLLALAISRLKRRGVK